MINNMKWNFNIDEAPSGHREKTKSVNKHGKEITLKKFVHVPCLIATKCGLVIPSKKLECGRWNFLAKNELPLAWCAYLEHPHNELTNTEETK